MKRARHARHLAILGVGAFLCVQVAHALTISPPQFELGDSGTYSDSWHEFDMDVGGGKYAVAWLDSSSQVKVTLAPTGGTSASGTYILNSGLSGVSYQGSVSIAWNGTTFGVVWMAGNTANDYKLYYNTLTPGGAIGSWKQVALSSANYHGPDLVWDGSRYVVVYTTYGPPYDLRAGAFNAAGDPVAPSTLVVRLPASASALIDPMFGGPDAFSAKIASNGTGYGIVYYYAGDSTVWYAYLNGSLAVQSGFPTRISDATAVHSAPRICLGPGSEFGCVWQHANGGGGQIYFARLGSGGVIAGPSTVAAALNEMRPDIAWDGGRYILAWSEAPASGQWLSKAATLTSGGSVEDTPVTVWPSPSGASSGTRVGSHSADNYLLVMRDGNFAKIYGNNASNQLMLTTAVNPVGGGTVDVPSPGSSGGTSGPYALNQNVTVTATPTGGGDWAFTNWTGDTSGASISGNQITVTMDRAKGVTANFYNTAWPTLTLNKSPSGGGTTTINGASASSAQAAPGATMALVATANTGYIFNSWRDGGDTTTLSTNRSYTISMPGSNTTLLAKFDVAYSVSTTGNPTNGGSVSPTGALWYAAGSQVAFTASPSANYTFTGWNVNGVDSGNANPITVTIDSNKTIYANFSYGGGGTTYTLLTAASPSGTGSVAPAGTSTYASGAIVQLTATPATGYRFDHWTGSASGSTNPLNITMNANKTVTAQFEEGTSGNQPQISGLSQKTSISSKRASFTLDYADTDGDLSGGTLKAEYRYKSNGKLYKTVYDIPDELTSITGTTIGTIEVRILFRRWKTSYRNFTLNLTVTDAGGLGSNVISYTVRKNKKGNSSPGAIGSIDQSYDE